MLSEMTSVHFTEWMLVFQRWHLGEDPNDRDDFRTGTVAATVANVQRGKGQKALQPQDFYPKFTDAGETPDIYSQMSELVRPERKPKAKSIHRGKNTKVEPTEGS